MMLSALDFHASLMIAVVVVSVFFFCTGFLLQDKLLFEHSDAPAHDCMIISNKD